MKSRIDSPLPGRLTRRTAMVTISAPDSSCACRMISLLEYLPVPTISRDVKSLPPSTRFVSCITFSSRSSHRSARREARLTSHLPNFQARLGARRASPRTCQISRLGSARGAPHLAPPPMGRTISTRSPSRSATEPYAAFGVISRLTATAVYSRFTARCVSSASTLSPSATSISRPFTVIFIETKTAAPPVEGAAACVRAVFPSPALPGSGSRGPGPHPVLRNPPPTTPGPSIHPPRFDLTGAGCYLVRHGSRPTRPHRSVPMNGTTRRQFLKKSAATSTGLATWLALGRAPAFAQKRELTFLSWNHFVPASDDELRKQAEAFGKQAGVTVRVDTIAHLQLPAKRAAEAQAQSGHDLLFVADADPFLYENQFVELGDVIDDLGKKYGGWYAFAEEAAKTKAGWRAVPWFWVSFPGTYNMAHFKKAGLEHPKTWDELLHHGKLLKKQGNPVGIPISHCSDAHSTFWSVLWCYGGKVLEADGKTPAINSDKTVQVIEWYKELYHDAMEPEVLSWDDASNNRCILAGKCSWIHNPISPYNTAIASKMPIADDINHHPSPAGPAGTHGAPGINALGIWKFSKNVEPAKELVQYLFRKENFDAWIVASNAFNQPTLRNLADHPIWVRNPKFAMLPKEAEFAHPRGWPAKPTDAVQRIDDNYIMADMLAKAVNGMPAKRAMAWAEDQIKLALKGQLKVS